MSESIVGQRIIPKRNKRVGSAVFCAGWFNCKINSDSLLQKKTVQNWKLDLLNNPGENYLFWLPAGHHDLNSIIRRRERVWYNVFLVQVIPFKVANYSIQIRSNDWIIEPKPHARRWLRFFIVVLATLWPTAWESWLRQESVPEAGDSYLNNCQLNPPSCGFEITSKGSGFQLICSFPSKSNDTFSDLPCPNSVSLLRLDQHDNPSTSFDVGDCIYLI